MPEGVAVAVGLFLAGIVLLYVGAELLVKGAGGLALGFGLRPVVVGVTVVAVATTAPELFVSLIGVLEVSTDIGLGAIVGSNLANIGLVLGVAAMIRPLPVSDTVLRHHVPFMVVAALLLVGLGANGRLSRIDGIVLLLVLAAFTGYLLFRLRTGRSAAPDAEMLDPPTRSATLRNGVLTAGGLVGLVLGSRWLIDGGRSLLAAAGFSDLFIGLTVLAFGTSLPEFAASVVGAIRDETGFSVGNVVGSNIYNILAVIGIVAVIVPIPVSAGVRGFEFPVLVAFTVVAVALMYHGRRISRVDGAILFLGYGAFLYLLFP